MRFEGFAEQDVATPRGTIHVRTKGDGPPLLLLHGYPETHLMWHSTAPQLAERFTVIAADLPGYGASFRPVVSDDHSAHSKRAMATDLVAAMQALGHERFAVAGHDRGGRVAYRMALDHPDAVSKLAALDIVPTGQVWTHANATFAIGYWHWAFLAQPRPMPERLILGDPDAFWTSVQRIGITDAYPDDVVAAYRAQLDDPETVGAMCEDYRAGATIDRELDQQETGTIACPTLVLWGAHGALPIFYEDPLELWRPFAPDLRGHGVADSSHFIPEDQPGATLEAFEEFF